MTITKSGELASFYTVNKTPIKHLRVYFSPKQAGSGDPSPENVREISGWNGVDLYNSKTIDLSPINYTPETINGGLITYLGDNRYSFTGNLSAVTNFDIPINLHMDANKKYYMYIITSRAEDTNFGLSFRGSGTYSIVILNNDSTVHNISDTPTSDKNYTVLRIKIAPAAKDFTFGLYITEDPATSIITNWLNSVGTVYGGYVDLITGEVVEKWGGVTLNSNMNVYISGDSYRGTNCTDVWFDAGSNNWGYTASYATDLNENNTKCDTLNFSNKAIWSNPDLYPWSYVLNSYNQIHCVFVNSEIGITTEDTNAEAIIKIKNWISNHSITIKYLLDESKTIRYTIAPTQLQNLLGRNNIWSNADRVEIEYDLAESNDILYRRRNVLEKQYPHIITPTANGLINFNTDIKAPLKQCKVYFSPIQEGEGDPSPENARPIDGWTGIEVYSAGKNLINPDLYTLRLQPDSANKVLKSASVYGALSIPVPTGTSLHFSKNASAGSYFLYGAVEEAKIGSTYTGGWTSTNYSNLTVTEQNNTGKYVYILTSNDYLATAFEIVEAQVEIGEEKTSYEKPSGKKFIIDWSSTGTVYGGYVDLVTGKIWKTWDIIDLGTCTWIQYNNNHSIFYTRNLANLKERSDQYTVLCTAYPYEQQSYVTATNDKTINDSQQLNMGNVAIRDTNYTNSTPAEFKEAMNGVICAYKLATPILVTTLTPLQLKTLRGINNIWSNSNGNIELSYWTH